MQQQSTNPVVPKILSLVKGIPSVQKIEKVTVVEEPSLEASLVNLVPVISNES